MIKRVFDIVLSLVGMIAFFPFLLLAAVLIRMETKGPAFFRQQRIGKNFRPFFIYKLRTMHEEVCRKDGTLDVTGPMAVTRVGRILRKAKIDELPQLINVLKGEMSIVGPRPELPYYVALFQEDYQILLQVRPGITDPASIRFRHESELLAKCENPQQEYVCRILPEKIRLAKEYIQNSSLKNDLWILWRTFLALLNTQPQDCVAKAKKAEG